jgi:hypothetical protein
VEREWLPLQLTISAVSALVTLAGFVRAVVGAPAEEPARVDAVLLLVLGLCLLPTVVYLLGVRSRQMVIVFGACLLVPTVVTWLSYSLDFAPLGVLVFVAVPFTFVTSVIGAIIDRSLP